jgi:hypothetical protein
MQNGAMPNKYLNTIIISRHQLYRHNNTLKRELIDQHPDDGQSIGLDNPDFLLLQNI